MELEKKYMEKVKEVSGEILHEMLKEAQNKGCKAHITVNVLEKSTEGGVKHTIAEYVDKVGPACLIVASRGAGAFGRAFIGSVSDYLVHNVTVPVIVVKQ